MTKTYDDLFIPRGTGGEGADPVVVTPETAGWTYSGLRVVALGPGDERTLATGNSEFFVLPLGGSCVVEAEGKRFELTGRDSVWSRISDFAYVPIDAELRLSSAGGGEFALGSAVAARRLDPAYGPAEAVPVSVRGAGQATRQIIAFCMPDAFEADKLQGVEVLTPSGNFSSYPPHKHDEFDPDCPEVPLEEIYYFRIRGQGGYALFREYAADGEFDITATVADGDVALCPRGYHGPSVAVPGHDMYFLNVMAGPGDERVWHACDDPDQTWVRAGWEGQAQDPRLPMTTSEGART